MHGDLTRSKSNKGSVDGQFSHEFLHRTVWRGRLVGFCAGWLFPVQLYQAAERLFLHTRTSMARSCATTTAGPSRRRLKKAVQQGPSNSLYLSLGERPRLPFTARIERAQFHRARSASKKGAWLLPPCWQTFSASCYSGTRISIQGGVSSPMSENRRAVLLAGIPGKTAPRRISTERKR